MEDYKHPDEQTAHDAVSMRQGARSKDALRKLFTDKANDLFDLVEGDALKQREMSILRLKTHFNKMDLQKQIALQHDIVEETYHKEVKKCGSIRQRFIDEVVHELEHRYKAYFHIRNNIDKFKYKMHKLDKEIKLQLNKARAAGAGSRRPEPKLNKITGTKLEVGIIQGQLSAVKSQESQIAFGQNSIYYTIQHAGKVVQTSNKYHILKKATKDSGSADSQVFQQIQPHWNEVYSFTLSGDLEESLLFEVFRHNSCEGDIQLDQVEVKLREDPMLFDLLSDQRVHALTFYSTLHDSMVHQPSFETDKNPSSQDDSGSNSSLSSFKISFRWKNDESTLKLSELTRKKESLETKVQEDESLQKGTKQTYDNLMHFKKECGVPKLLDVLGIPTVAPILKVQASPANNESLLRKSQISPIRKSVSPQRQGRSQNGSISGKISQDSKQKSDFKTGLSQTQKIVAVNIDEKDFEFLTMKTPVIQKDRSRQSINLADLLHNQEQKSLDQPLSKVYNSYLINNQENALLASQEKKSHLHSQNASGRKSALPRSNPPVSLGSSQKRISLNQSNSQKNLQQQPNSARPQQPNQSPIRERIAEKQRVHSKNKSSSSIKDGKSSHHQSIGAHSGSRNSVVHVPKLFNIPGPVLHKKKQSGHKEKEPKKGKKESGLNHSVDYGMDASFTLNGKNAEDDDHIEVKEVIFSERNHLSSGLLTNFQNSFKEAEPIFNNVGKTEDNESSSEEEDGDEDSDDDNDDDEDSKQDHGTPQELLDHPKQLNNPSPHQSKGNSPNSESKGLAHPVHHESVLEIDEKLEESPYSSESKKQGTITQVPAEKESQLESNEVQSEEQELPVVQAEAIIHAGENELVIPDDQPEQTSNEDILEIMQDSQPTLTEKVEDNKLQDEVLIEDQNKEEDYQVAQDIIQNIINEILVIISTQEVNYNLQTMDNLTNNKLEETKEPSDNTLYPIQAQQMKHHNSTGPVPKKHPYYTQISEIIEVTDSLMTSESEPSKRSSSHRETLQTNPPQESVPPTSQEGQEVIDQNLLDQQREQTDSQAALSQGTAEFDGVEIKEVVEVLHQDKRISMPMNDDEILNAEVEERKSHAQSSSSSEEDLQIEARQRADSAFIIMEPEYERPAGETQDPEIQIEEQAQLYQKEESSQNEEDQEDFTEDVEEKNSDEIDSIPHKVLDHVAHQQSPMLEKQVDRQSVSSMSSNELEEDAENALQVDTQNEEENKENDDDNSMDRSQDNQEQIPVEESQIQLRKPLATTDQQIDEVFIATGSVFNESEQVEIAIIELSKEDQVEEKEEMNKERASSFIIEALEYETPKDHIENAEAADNISDGTAGFEEEEHKAEQQLIASNVPQLHEDVDEIHFADTAKIQQQSNSNETSSSPGEDSQEEAEMQEDKQGLVIEEPEYGDLPEAQENQLAIIEEIKQDTIELNLTEIIKEKESQIIEVPTEVNGEPQMQPIEENLQNEAIQQDDQLHENQAEPEQQFFEEAKEEIQEPIPHVQEEAPILENADQEPEQPSQKEPESEQASPCVFNKVPHETEYEHHQHKVHIVSIDLCAQKPAFEDEVIVALGSSFNESEQVQLALQQLTQEEEVVIEQAPIIEEPEFEREAEEVEESDAKSNNTCGFEEGEKEESKEAETAEIPKLKEENDEVHLAESTNQLNNADDDKSSESEEDQRERGNSGFVIEQPEYGETEHHQAVIESVPILEIDLTNTEVLKGGEKLEEVKEHAQTIELLPEVQPKVQQIEEVKQEVVLENFTVKRSKRQLVACSQPRYINFDQSEAKANEFTMIEAKQIDLIYSQSDLPLEAKSPVKLQIASSKYQLVPKEPLPQEDPLPQEEDPLQDSPVILQVDPEKPISNSEAPSSNGDDDLSNHDQQDSQEEEEPFLFVTDQADMALREAKQRDLDQQNEGFAADDRLETCNEKESEESKEELQARNIRTEENDEILPRATESFEGEITPKHLSEVSSGKSRELSNQEPEESKEILQPTLENMKRIELKNQRRDIGGSLATSNILDLINLHQNSMHGSDDPQQPPLLHYTSQNAPQTSKNLGSTMMPPRFSLRQPALHNPFSTLNKARSLFQEPIMHPPAPSHYKLHQSQHSGKSMGSKIGFLMKSIDGGALFTRGALHKEIQNSNGGNSSIMEDGKAFQNHDDSYHQEEVNDQYYNTGGNAGNSAANAVQQQPQKREDTQESQEHESPDSKNAQKQRLGHMFMAQPGMVGFGLSGMMGQMAMMKNMNRQQ